MESMTVRRNVRIMRLMTIGTAPGPLDNFAT